MKALVLAAGLGTRMKPFTFFRAKATLPLLNVPFIHYPLQYLSTNGIKDVVINTHAHPESVRKVAGTQYANLRISYSHEPEILGTAGAMRKAAPLLDDEPFVVMNSDMIMEIPLQQVLDYHRSLDSDVTLVIMKDARFAHYGGLYFEGDPLRLSGFRNGPGESYHYTGFQIVSPRILENIPLDTKTGIFTDIYPSRIPDWKIHGFVYQGLWKEMGNLKEYLRTSIELLRNPLPAPLQPPGSNHSMISDRAEIQNESEVIDSIIMEGATVESGAQIDHCIIGWDLSVNGSIRNEALARGMLPYYF